SSRQALAPRPIARDHGPGFPAVAGSDGPLRLVDDGMGLIARDAAIPVVHFEIPDGCVAVVERLCFTADGFDHPCVEAYRAPKCDAPTWTRVLSTAHEPQS